MPEMKLTLTVNMQNGRGGEFGYRNTRVITLFLSANSEKLQNIPSALTVRRVLQRGCAREALWEVRRLLPENVTIAELLCKAEEMTTG